MEKNIDNQYKPKKTIAIAIGLIISRVRNPYLSICNLLREVPYNYDA